MNCLRWLLSWKFFTKSSFPIRCFHFIFGTDWSKLTLSEKYFRMNWPLTNIKVQKNAKYSICSVSCAVLWHVRKRCFIIHSIFHLLFISLHNKSKQNKIAHNKSKNKLRKIMSGIVLINEIYMAKELITLDSPSVRLWMCFCG